MMQYGFNTLIRLIASRLQLDRLKSHFLPSAFGAVKSSAKPFLSPKSSAMAQTRGGL